MGGNVWEWIDDIKGDNSLTAGGSWWYDSSKTKFTGAQYKPSNFYAIYVGFRCCLLYTSPSPRDRTRSRMPSSA